MGACRESPFVLRGVGRSGDQGGFVLLRPGRGGPGASKPGSPLPSLARCSYRGPSAAAAASSSSRSASLPACAPAAAAAAAVAARRAPGPGKRERSELGAARARSRSGRGRPEPGHPLILLGVAAASSPELGERLGEGRLGWCWVTGDESWPPSRRMRTPPAPPGRAPGLAGLHLQLGEDCQPGAAVRPREPQEARFDPASAPFQKEGEREARRLNLGPAAGLLALRPHSGFRPGQPPG